MQTAYNVVQYIYIYWIGSTAALKSHLLYKEHSITGIIDPVAIHCAVYYMFCTSLAGHTRKPVLRQPTAKYFPFFFPPFFSFFQLARSRLDHRTIRHKTTSKVSSAEMPFVRASGDRFKNFAGKLPAKQATWDKGAALVRTSEAGMTVTQLWLSWHD